MEGNYNHTAHSLSIVSQFQTPQPKHKTKIKIKFFLPLKSKKSITSYKTNQENLANLDLTNESSSTTRKPSRSIRNPTT